MNKKAKEFLYSEAPSQRSTAYVPVLQSSRSVRKPSWPRTSPMFLDTECLFLPNMKSCRMSTQQSPLGDTVSPQMLVYSLFQFRFHGKGKWESMRWGVSVLPRQSAGVEWEKPGCYVLGFCLFASFLFEKINTGNYKNSTESSNTFELHLLKCLFNSLVHFLIGLFVSLLLSLKSSLYILDTSPLSDMRLANYRPPFFSLSFHPFVAAQSLSRVQLFVTPWTAAHQASLSFTISWILLKLMSIELVMPRDFYSPKLLVLMESSVLFYFFLWIVLLMVCLRSLFPSLGHKDFLLKVL